MKTQISRDSFDGAKRYSGVYLQQGRMIVDADLNELTDIVKARLEGALADAVGSGTPRVGALAIAKSGPNFVIQPGRVYADGVPARLDAATPIALTAQPDYRNPPALPANNFRVYADVWERPVSALEDNALQDAGLHGADTATRSKTMLQVKWCDRASDPLNQAQNPRRGNALLKLKLRLITATADKCDPCAAEVAIDERIGNYLFRVEVHDVFTEAGQTHVVLKWSRDNGAEAYASGAYPADFDQGAWVWEFFDSDSENLLGHHFPAGQKRRRGEIRTAFNPLPAAGLPSAFVRQWDGYAEFNLNTGALVAGRDRGVDLSTGLADTAHAFVKIDSGAGTIQINLELLELTLAYGGKSFVAGDYWQVAVREAIDTSGKIVLGDPSPEPPRGVLHHYVFLRDVDGAANLVGFSDALRRRMSFPPLTDVHAGDVGFTNECSDLYGAAENVQQALDALCNIGAEDIGYTVPACGTAAAPSVRSLLASLPGFPDRDGVAKSPSVKDILDYLMCDLNAARLPYDGNLQSARWTDINEGATPPLNVQQALDNLVANLDGGDISANLPACADGTGSGSSTLQQLLALPGGSQPVLEWLRRLYCDVRATHIPLDRSRLVCADLATDPSVVSVQDALDKLCQTAGHGCEITVAAGELEKRLRDFAASDVLDIALCLLPGKHEIREPISVTGKGSIRITGASVASDIRFGGALNVFGAAAILLEDLTISLVGGGQLQLNATRVSSVRCNYSRAGNQKNTELRPGTTTTVVPGVRIGALTQRVHWQHNLMVDTWYRPIPPSVDFTDLEVVGNARVADGFRRLTDDPDIFSDAVLFNATLDEITDAVAAMPAADRKRWATVIDARNPAGPVAGLRGAKKGVKGASKAAARATAKKKSAVVKAAADPTRAPAVAAAGRIRVGDEIGGAVGRVGRLPIVVDVSAGATTPGSKAFTEVIIAANPTREAIRDGVVGGVLEAMFEFGVNVALGISSHQTNTTLSSNEIYGEVLLMNQLEATPAVAADAATDFRTILPTLDLVPPVGSPLTLDGNRLDRLWALVPRLPPQQQLTIPLKGFSACTLQGNHLIDLNNAVVARKLALHANHFDGVPREEFVFQFLGRMLARVFTAVGNTSEDSTAAVYEMLSSAAARATSNYFTIRKV